MNYITTDTELTNIADAIRTKGGTASSLVYPNGFISAIGAIPSGGGIQPAVPVTVWRDYGNESYYIIDSPINNKFIISEVSNGRGGTYYSYIDVNADMAVGTVPTVKQASPASSTYLLAPQTTVIRNGTSSVTRTANDWVTLPSPDSYHANSLIRLRGITYFKNYASQYAGKRMLILDKDAKILANLEIPSAGNTISISSYTSGQDYVTIVTAPRTISSSSTTTLGNIFEIG